MATNLAIRPFRNERVPWLLASATLGASIAISILHVRVATGLLAGDEAKTVRAVREDEARIEELENGLRLEPPLRVSSTELVNLRAFKDLVDRRVFPWRRLLSSLETILPDGIRLTRVQPGAANDKASQTGMLIRLTGESRTKDGVFTLAEEIDAAPAFSNAILKSLSEEEAVTEFEIEVLFDPAPLDPALVPASGATPTPEKVPPPVDQVKAR